METPMTWRRAAACAAVLCVAPGAALAHGGGVDAQGCHTNRKTGDRHCHGARPKSVRPAALMSSPKGSRGPTFSSCAEARAAGAAPLRRGQPGYSTKMDRDGDGVACE